MVKYEKYDDDEKNGFVDETANASANPFAVFSLQDYKLKSIQEYSELAVYSAICFFVPFLIGHPQLVVGIIVNAALVLSALNHKSKMLLPVIILPSLGVLSRGLIFGPLTYFLIIMIPFIWIGNAILVYSFKKLKLERKMNSIIALIAGASAKAIFLFGTAFLLYSLGILPALFLATMGVFQLYTALAGGSIALGIQYAKRKIMKAE